MIELNQLEQLIYIAENKTISKAAKELLISQPALSRSMQKLESDLGVELFDHYKNKIVLNKNGELAVKHAQKIIKSIQTMINDVQDYDQSFHRISIATCSPAPMWDIEPLIKELYPQINIQTAVINKKDLLTKLKEKEYHLVITPEYIDDSQYFCIPYVEEDLLLSLPLNHPLASKKEIKFHDLDGQTMLLYSNIGFWHDLHMQKTPKTKYLLQEERLTFNEIVKASTLPSYTSNLSIKREGKMSDRVILPINEEEAHVTYYVVMLKKNKKKYKDLIDKIEHYYDMFVPIVEEEENYISYDKAIPLVYAALEPLGEEYEDIAYKAFNERWIDVYSSEDKVGGGYCLSVYNNHPYILLNYDNSLDSVSTLVHELGHGVYGYLSQKNQEYYNAQPSIFTHEVASTTNEALLYEFLIKNAGNDKQKAYYITQYMDFIKDTLYTQTMYAEFERDVHAMLENNENVNTLVLNDLWSHLLKKYYGNDFEVDPLAMIGWARIPHFYNSFYVYKYATGCSSAISFAQDILNDGPEDYLNFLKKGGSDKPLNLLKSGGVDLTNDKSIQVSIDKFNKLLVELEKLTNN